MKWILSWKQIFAVALLLVSVWYVTQIIAIDMLDKVVWEYGLTYFLMYHLPKILPLIIVGLYCLVDYKVHIVNKFLDVLSKAILVLVVTVGFAILSTYLMGLPLSVLMGDSYTWSYEAIIEWIFCFVVCWILTNHKLSSSITALTYAVVAVSAGGDLHEFAFGILNINHYYHPTYPLLISTQILSIIILILLMKEHHWKLNKLTAIAFVMYVVFTIVYATIINPNIKGIWHLPNLWIPRLPIIFLLASIPTGFNYGKLKAD